MPAVLSPPELLRSQLQEIVRVVPASAVKALRQVPLYFSPEYPGREPTAEFHPDAGWLQANGRDPAMATAVEFTNVNQFEAEMDRMPNFTLHQLAPRLPPPRVAARLRESGTQDGLRASQGKWSI